MSVSDLDRRTLILAMQQQAAKSEIMVAFATGDGAAEHAVRMKIHELLDIELDQLAERLRINMGL